MCDFIDNIKSKMMILLCETLLKLKENNIEEIMVKQLNIKYKKIDIQEEAVECTWIPIIRYKYNCGKLKIIDCLNINFPHPSQLSNHPYNRQILESIQNSKAIVATDA